MKVLTKKDLILLLQSSPKPSYDEREIIKLFDTFGEDYFIDGNEFKQFGENYHMKQIRSEEMKKTKLARDAADDAVKNYIKLMEDAANEL